MIFDQLDLSKNDQVFTIHCIKCLLWTSVILQLGTTFDGIIVILDLCLVINRVNHVSTPHDTRSIR